MGRLMTALAAILLTVGHTYAEAPQVGQSAPEFSATDILTGEKITLSQFKGKPVVLEWNNFECPFVKKFYSVGSMQALQGRARKDGAIWITINSSAAGKEGHLATGDDAKTAIANRKAQPSRYLLDHDGAIGHLYGAKNTPQMFVVDKGGVLAYAGAIDSVSSPDPTDIKGATNYVSAALDDLNSGHAVKTPVTQPYGCFVKY